MAGRGQQARSMVSRRGLLRVAAGVSALPLGGCLRSGPNPVAGADDPKDVTTNIRISGSSTVFPIATAVAELFKETHPDVVFDISKDGSSGGFENVFVPGDSDLNNSSRPITRDEVAACRENGFEPVEFLVAKDALTVVKHNDNEFIDALTYDELEQIWQPEPIAETWDEIRDEWPAEPIDLYGPASTSGTFDYFTSTILGEAGRIRDDFEGTEEDDQIAAGVQRNEYALGYLPFAYYTNNPDETTAVRLAETAKTEPVAPSLEAAASGAYALARPLFFYANDQRLREKAPLQEFIAYYVERASDTALIADRIGYVPSPAEQVATNTDRLESAIDGTYRYEFDDTH